MNIDFRFNDKDRFSVRASAIIYNKDKTKVLLFTINDGRDYYLLPGGRIEYFESSHDAIKREIYEETGLILEFKFGTFFQSKSMYRYIVRMKRQKTVYTVRKHLYTFVRQTCN